MIAHSQIDQNVSHGVTNRIEPMVVLRFCAYAASVGAILFGCAGLAGWVTFESVKKGVPGMVPNAGLCFILTGLALWFLRVEGVQGVKQRLGQVLACVVVAFGALTLSEYFFAWDAGVDGWLFRDTVAASQKVIPGRLAIFTATNFSLLGLSVLLLNVRGRSGHKPAELLALTAMLISLLALIGYICKVPLFYGWRSLYPNTTMSLSTVVAFLVLGAGVLCTRPCGGLMGILTSPTAGGFIARRLILAPVLIPLVTGWVKLATQRQAFYNAEWAGWLLSFANIFVFTLIIWWCARLIYQAEVIRERAEMDLHQLNTELEGRIEERTLEIRQLNAQLEQRVSQRTAELEAANKELEAFCYSVSHDLRTPVRHIGGYVDMLRDELQPVLTQQGGHYLGVITTATHQMGTLIDNLLSFSRMGRTQMSQDRINSDELIQEVMEELKPETKGRAIAWDIAALPELDGDRPMLKQVWLNLLSNAINYTRQRPRAEIKIGCARQSDEIEFYVQDNGAGFDMKYASKLFGVFQRLHLTEEFEGTGIGLANVHRIIARHGGRIWAEGKVDTGATFRFSLPAHRQP